MFLAQTLMAEKIIFPGGPPNPEDLPKTFRCSLTAVPHPVRWLSNTALQMVCERIIIPAPAPAVTARALRAARPLMEQVREAAGRQVSIASQDKRLVWTAQAGVHHSQARAYHPAGE